MQQIQKKIEAMELQGYSRIRCKTLCIQPLDRRRCNPQPRPSTSFVAHTIDLPWRNFLSPQFGANFGDGKKVKGSPYSITERRVPELIPVLGSQPAGDVSHKPCCHYFPPGWQLPPQPLRGLLPILLLGEQRHSGCEQFA